ncbi:unnamed protein product [Parnassius apollo]|uniref:(apollo) hypothetical protein n=1 Tax=Parnassius apollo TaxID=110799 RepID=A0A8S3W290_PARAO|nr:unnamed protein product [Parnassius apollo]
MQKLLEQQIYQSKILEAHQHLILKIHLLETATCNVTETPKQKKKTTSSFESEILKAIKNESGMDEDKIFCLSLVQSLKKMDDDSKVFAKIEILKVLRTFTNRTQNSQPVRQPNQSPFNRTNIEPYFSYLLLVELCSNFSAQTTPIIHTNLQPTSAQTRNMYQQHSQSENSFIYTQTPQQQYSQTMFTQASNIYQQQHLESQPTLSLHHPHPIPYIHQKLLRF